MKLKCLPLVPLAVLALVACGSSTRQPATASRSQSVTTGAVSTTTATAAASRPGHAHSHDARGTKPARHRVAPATRARPRSSRAQQHPERKGTAPPRGQATSRSPTAKKQAPARKAAPKKRAPPAAPESLTLALKGGSNATLSACGVLHHYRVYAAGTTISYSGTVTPVPTGHWKVKLKIKVCSGGTFIDLVKVDASRNDRTGVFRGTFPAPPTGDYEARAELYVADIRTARSDKSHFAIS
jgi:hypothetical protein